MKKFCKRVLMIVLCLSLSVTALVGCGSNGSKVGDKILNIGYFQGEYGVKWAVKLAADFEAANPGVTVKLHPNASIVGEIPTQLEKKPQKAIYDLFFSHGIEWEVDANSGLLEPLDEVYASEVAPGVTVESRVLDQFLPTSKFKGKGDDAQRYYKLHWTNGVGGIVYNKKMFDDRGWAVPKTYEELIALCDQIVAAKIVSPGNPDEKIKPFVYSKEDYYWDYLVFDWMLQLCGKEALDDFLKLESAQSFNPQTSVVVQAQREALSKWADLIAKNPKYSMVNSIGKEYDVAQSDFINGNAAMIPNAQWLESGMLANLDEEKCVMAMMPTPFLENAIKDKVTGKPIRYSRSVGGDDSIIIPKNAPNKPLAKKFLTFMCKEENAMKFTQNTHGVMLGLKYDAQKLQDMPNNTEFMKTVFEINSNSVKFDTYSPSWLRLDGHIKCEWFTQNGFAPYPEVLKDSTQTSIDKIFTDYYSYVSTKWGGWSK